MILDTSVGKIKMLSLDFHRYVNFYMELKVKGSSRYLAAGINLFAICSDMMEPDQRGLYLYNTGGEQIDNTIIGIDLI